MEKEMYSESILQSTKKMLGIMPEDTSFDLDITNYINSAIATLTQLGVGPTEGFFIIGEEQTFKDFLGEGYPLRNQMVKSYLTQKVKMMFDPPQTSALIEVNKEVIRELEFRLQCDNDDGR